MNFLLLLSALVSALTGVGAGVAHTPIAAQQVTAVVQTAANAVVAPSTTAGPHQVFDVARARRTIAPLRKLTPLGIAAYASRRRE